MSIPRTIALLAVAALATHAHADPFDRQRVPADAKWLVHADVDAARSSTVCKALHQQLVAVPEYKTKIDQVSVVTGMSFPKDLHDVTLYGRASGDEAVVVIVHAHMDRQRMLVAVSTAPDYATHHVGTYDIVRWTDHGKTKFGAFHDDGTLVVARSEANVTAALDTLDGKAPAMAADGPMSGTTPATTRPAVGAGDHPLVYMAVNDLPSLVTPDFDPPGPLKQVKSACLAMTESGKSLDFHASLTTRSDETAEQLRTAAEGLRAMLAFAASGPDARPDLKEASDVLKTATFGRADSTVTADLSIPLDHVRASLDGSHFGLGVDDPDRSAATRRSGTFHTAEPSDTIHREPGDR